MLFIYETLCHNNDQSNVPVGHIMVSLYYWHSIVNKSFEIKIGSEQNVNCLKTIYFKGRPSLNPDYAKAAFIETILLLFSHKNFTHEKITHAFIYHENVYNY